MRLYTVLRAQQKEVWLVLAVLALVTVVMAIFQRSKGDTHRTYWNLPLKAAQQNFLLHLLRAVCSCVAFVALSLLTSPGLTCLFPDYSQPGGTSVPSWLSLYVLFGIAGVLSWLSTAVPGFVTDTAVVQPQAVQPPSGPGPRPTGIQDPEDPARQSLLDAEHDHPSTTNNK